MKNNKMIIIPIICMIIASTFFSTAANCSDFYYEDKDITVLFPSNSELSYEQKQVIADKLIYGYLNDNQVSTYSLCWLVGHNLTSNAVTTIEHKVDLYEPRCLERVYDVETCSSCDYINEELISTTYVFCCAED